MRIPLIWSVNDMEEMITSTASLYQPYGLRRLTLLPYHDLGATKRRHWTDGRKCFSRRRHRVEKIRDIFERRANMRVEIPGKHMSERTSAVIRMPVERLPPQDGACRQVPLRRNGWDRRGTC